jgi:preprotein translocase subunit SecF
MNAYRTSARRTEASPLTYDYAKALDQNRSSLASIAARLMLAFLMIVGVWPFVALFGDVGVLIGVAASAFVAIPVAIRASRQNSAARIDAYQERLLAKRRKRRAR